MLTSPGLVPLGSGIGVLGVLGDEPELLSVYVLSVVGVVGVVAVGIAGVVEGTVGVDVLGIVVVEPPRYQDVDGRKIEGLLYDEKDDGLKLLENLDDGLYSEELNLF